MPETTFLIRDTPDGRQIFDPLRRRYVPLTPEENVRQHFVHFLISQRGFPAGLIGNEVMVRVNGMCKRCDTLVCDRSGKPKMIIEYKAPSVPISQKVFDQISRYNTVMHVDYLIVSNGKTTFCARMNYDTLSFDFLPEIPHYENL